MKTNKQTEGPVWIIDNDNEDHELIKEIFEEASLPNSLRFFNGAEQVLKQFEKEDKAPFIVICNVNLAKIDGFQLREKMLKTPNMKYHSVPFIFWSAHPSEAQVEQAYVLRAHGFFIKEPKIEEWKASLVAIIEYWRRSKMPSKASAPDEPQTVR